MNILGNRRSKAFLGLSLNAMVAVFMVFISVKHTGWESIRLLPEKRLMHDEQLLRICYFDILPIGAAVMIFSAALFWMLRKNE